MSLLSNTQGNRDVLCPYKGLMPYLEEDSPFFFGREKWSRIILDNLMASRLTLLYGSSGVGKSSVLRAGVVPQLSQAVQQHLKESASPEFAIIVFNTWRDNPVIGLLRQVENDVKKVLSGAPILELGDSLTEALQKWAKLLGTEDKKGKLLIILDQFEDYFLYHPNERGKESFAEQFPEAIKSPDLPANFLLSIREDALAKLDRFKGSIPNLFGNYLRIPHLDEQAALDAIRKPIRIYNQQQQPGAQSMGIEPELVKEVIEQVKVGKVSLDESGRGGINLEPMTPAEVEIETPYLQLVMIRLWEEEIKNSSDRLRLETLKRLGGAENMVKQHLNERMKPLTVKEKDIAAKVFQYLVTPGGTKIAYPALELAETAGVSGHKLEILLERLSSSGQRILRPVGPSPEQPNVERYEIFHDKLAPAILAWRKEYQSRQNAKRSKMVAAVVSFLGVIFLGLFIRAEYQRSQAALSETNAILAASNARLVSKEYFNSLMDGLRAFRTFKGAKSSWTLRWFFDSTTKEVLRQEIKKQLQIVLDRVNEQNRLVGHKGQVVEASFGYDDKTFATASQDGTIKLWNLEGKVLQTFNGHQTEFWSVSYNDRILVAAGTDSAIKIWSLSGKEIAPLRGHKGWVWSVNFSPDGQTLASAGADGTIKLWHFDGQKFASLPFASTKASESNEANKKGILHVSFSPNGKILATAGNEGIVKLWSFNGKILKHVKTLAKKHTDWVWDVGFSPDGQMLATASRDGTAKLWNLDGTERITLSGHKDAVTSVSFTTYGQKKVIATASQDGTVNLWDLEGKVLQTLSGQKDGVWRARFSPNGKILATTGVDKIVKLWNLNPQDLAGHTTDIFQIKFSTNGQTLASASKDKTVKFWNFDIQDPRYLRYLKTLKAHDNFITAVSFSPDGRTIATASADTTAKLWNLDGKFLKLLSQDKNSDHWMWDVSFSPDGRTIATASADKTAKLWNIDGTRRQTLIVGHSVVRSLSFSHDGKLLATASRDKIVKLWNLDGKAHQVGNTFKSGHDRYLTSVSLSPNGNTIATASLDGTVKLWSRDGQQIKEITPLEANKSKIRHDAGILSVSFSPDGQLLATASEDETVRLWNLNGKQINTFFGHIGGIIGVQFSPDGKFIASAGRDGRVILWNRDLTLEGVVRQSCDWVRGYLENNPDVKSDDKTLCKD
jgi:WD40 repeat protein